MDRAGKTRRHGRLAACSSGLERRAVGRWGYALVGGYEEEKGGVYTGAAWVFTRSGSTWSQQREDLIGVARSNDEEGYSVALSAEGNTALIGGPDDEEGEPGAAWNSTRSGTTWSEQAKLVGAHPSGLVQKGWSVALSGDGSTALIGGPSAEFKSGEPALGGAWIFTRSGTAWKELEQLPSGSWSGDRYGPGAERRAVGKRNDSVGGRNRLSEQSGRGMGIHPERRTLGTARLAAARELTEIPKPRRVRAWRSLKTGTRH